MGLEETLYSAFMCVLNLFKYVEKPCWFINCINHYLCSDSVKGQQSEVAACLSLMQSALVGVSLPMGHHHQSWT